MAPIVVGGRIFNLPQQDLSGLLGGVGDILSAIGQQRQQTRENQIFTDLSKALQGDVTPQGGVGPVRPAITDPQERLNTILNTALSGKVRSPQGLNRLLGIAQIQERAIPTATTAGGLSATTREQIEALRDPTGPVARALKAKEESATRVITERGVGVETARQTAIASQPLAQTNLPLFRTLVNKETGVQAPASLTNAQFNTDPNKFVSLDEKNRSGLVSLRAGKNRLSTLNSLVDKVFTEGEGIPARIGGAARRIVGGVTQVNKNVALFNRIKDSFGTQLSRFQGETGNIANQDVNRALKALPKDTDGAPLAKALMANVIQMMENMEKAILQKTDPVTVIDNAVNRSQQLRENFELSGDVSQTLIDRIREAETRRIGRGNQP